MARVESSASLDNNLRDVCDNDFRFPPIQGNLFADEHRRLPAGDRLDSIEALHPRLFFDFHFQSRFVLAGAEVAQG
jgi:hypothetical protein